jgi:hypothetical protein
MHIVRLLFSLLTMTLTFEMVRTDHISDTDAVRKDTCTKHGILKLIDEFYVPEIVRTNVILDLTDYFYYLDTLSANSVYFIDKQINYTTLEKLMNNVMVDEKATVIASFDDKTVYKISAKPHLGLLRVP